MFINSMLCACMMYKIFIRILLQKCQILLIQETLLPAHAFGLADESQEFEFSFVPSTCGDETCFSGRSSSGLAFVWTKQLTPFVEVIPFTDRAHGLHVKCGQR